MAFARSVSSAAVFGVLALFAGACLASQGHRDSVVVGERDDGRTLVIKRGAHVVIRLPAQMGTGYAWQLEPYDSLRVRQLAAPAMETLVKQPGGTELQVFRLAAIRPGSVRIRLRYVRPWERTAAPLKRIQLLLKIR